MLSCDTWVDTVAVGFSLSRRYSGPMHWDGACWGGVLVILALLELRAEGGGVVEGWRNGAEG